jgi:hypothetical protein
MPSRFTSQPLAAKRRKEIDAQIRRAYQGHGRDLLDEVEQLLKEQAWPAD